MASNWYQSSGYKRSSSRRRKPGHSSGGSAVAGSLAAPAPSTSPGGGWAPVNPGYSPNFGPPANSNVPGGAAAAGAASRLAGFARWFGWVGGAFYVGYELGNYLRNHPPEWMLKMLGYVLQTDCPSCPSTLPTTPTACNFSSCCSGPTGGWTAIQSCPYLPFNMPPFIYIYGPRLFSTPPGRPGLSERWQLTSSKPSRLPDRFLPEPVWDPFEDPLPLPNPGIDPTPSPIGRPVPHPAPVPPSAVPSIPDSPWRETGPRPEVVPVPHPPLRWDVDVRPAPRPGPVARPGPRPGPGPAPGPRPAPGPSTGPLPGPGGQPAPGPRTAPKFKRKPPGPRTKEKKRLMQNQAGWKIVNFLGGYVLEGVEYLDAMWWSLAPQYRSAPVMMAGAWVKPPVQVRAMDVYRNFEHVDWDKAVNSMAGNLLEDALIGTAGQALKKANINADTFAGGRSPLRGWATGPAL